MRIHSRIERLQPRAEHVQLSIDIVAGTERTARWGRPVRTKASFDLMGHMFSFCWAFVPMGFRSSGMALCSVLPTDCNEIY